jgi:hypothetical protein
MLSAADYARQALAAGPEVIANGAAVVRPEHDGTMRTLREGANGFTCLIMGTDRMCADKNGMQFIHAMMSQQPPPNKLGIAYMLGGDTGPTGEADGTGCQQSRSHMAVLASRYASQPWRARRDIASDRRSRQNTASDG